MLARLDPASSAGSSSRSATRRRTRPAPRPTAPGSPPRGGRRARRRASSAATTTARSSSVAASAPRRPDRRRPRHELGTHDGHWLFTPGQRRASASRPPSRSTRSRTEPRSNTVVVGPRGSLARDRLSVPGPALRAPTRVEAKSAIAPRPSGATVEQTARGFCARARRARVRGRAGPDRGPLRRGRRRGRRNRAAGGIKSRPCSLPSVTTSEAFDWRSIDLPAARRPRDRLRGAAPRRPSWPSFGVGGGNGAGAPAGDHKTRWDSRPGNEQLDKVDQMTDSAVDAVTASTPRSRAVNAIGEPAPVQALAGSRRGDPPRRLLVRDAPRQSTRPCARRRRGTAAMARPRRRARHRPAAAIAAGASRCALKIEAMRTTAELREGYRAFFESKPHTFRPSWPLIRGRRTARRSSPRQGCSG